MTTLPQSTSIQLPRPVGPGVIAPVHVGPVGPLAGNQQMSGGDIWRIIRANLWLIAGSVVLALVVGFALNWYLAKYHARYTAVGYIQVQTGRKFAGMGKIDLQGDQESLIVEQRTQSQILQTDALFTRVLQNKQDIRKTSWFQQFVNPDKTVAVASATEDLRRSFSAGPIPDSKLISVSMTWKDPQDARTIVTDVVNQHIEQQKQLSNARLENQVQALQTTANKYQGQLTTLKRDINSLQRTLQLQGDRPGGLGQKEQELNVLINKKLEADQYLNEAQAALDGAKSAVSRGETPGYVDQVIEQNYMVQNLQSRLIEIDIQLQSNRNGLDQATAQQSLRTTRQAIVEKLQEERDRLRASQTPGYLEGLSSRVDAAKQGVKDINTQMDSIKERLAETAIDMNTYLMKREEQASVEEQLRQTRDQLDGLNTALTQLDMNTVSWAVQPEKPQSPSFPRLPFTLAVCVMLGLGLSLGISFLRELLDTSVRSPRDIARVGQMNLLGMIPDESDDPQAAGVPIATVIYGAPTSMLAEQYRQVRTRLQHAASLDTTRSILITSPSPGDGKSTVACNLAAGLALNGRRILLVDANFRRPELHKIFGASNEAGFGNVLSSIENFESSVRQTRVPNLDLMTTGPKPANATELLESQLLIDFIDRALEEYDHVIFDSGPMLVVSETVALAPRVDGVVTVVRARANSRGLLTRMRDGLRQIKAEHLGVVLNGVRATGGGYYGRNIKTYYEYQNGAGSAA